MKNHIIITTLLIISCTILNGCMTTGPIVDDLDHYKKGDTYESIRERNEEESTANNENTEDVVDEEIADEINDTDKRETAENNEEQIIEESEEKE